jgi:hypothetical protein
VGESDQGIRHQARLGRDQIGSSFSDCHTL